MWPTVYQSAMKENPIVETRVVEEQAKAWKMEYHEPWGRDSLQVMSRRKETMVHTLN